MRFRYLSFTLGLALAVVVALPIAGCALHPGKVPGIVKASDAQPLDRRTVTGLVRGVTTPRGQAFLGIPFAAPPVGDLRFAPPRPAPAWASVRPATRSGPACGGKSTEDCLNLNIYAPHDAAPARPRPVMVWFYGGAFTMGSNTQYDLSALAERQGVIVVAPNYRLGALGFLAHPALVGGGEGAYGLLDQQAALRWVRDNIRGFGGDPKAVTAFGESAGALSICTLMTSPSAVGLFARAILESGPCVAKNSTIDRATAERAGLEIADTLGCREPATALSCLRALPAGRLAKAKSRRIGLSIKDGWTPMHGGDVLPLSPDAAFAAGRYTAVPLIQGTNAREGTLFSYLHTLRGKLLSDRRMRDLLAETFPGDEDAILREYGAVAARSRWEAVARLATDARFACPALRMNRLLADRGVRVWGYEFDDPDAPFGLPRFFQPRLGAFHASEIAYVLQRPWVLSGSLRFTPAQQALSDRMQDHWGRFARAGDPARDATAPWPRVAAGADPVPLAVDPVERQESFSARHRCAFWNARGY